MARVLFIPEEGNWVHADTGNKISDWAVENTEPHASEIARRGGGNGELFVANTERVGGATSDRKDLYPNEGMVPIPPTNPQVKEDYIEEILRDSNYA